MKNNSLHPDLDKLKQNKQLLLIFVLLLACVVFWAVITVLNSQQQSVISPELKNSALPLTPIIDETVLDNLEKEQTFSDAELADFVIYRLVKTEENTTGVLVPLGTEPPTAGSSATPTPTATPSPTPSPSATPVPSPSATSLVTPTPTPASGTGAQP